MWLVFRDEGASLHNLMYAPAIAGPHHTPPHASHGDELSEPSEWWWGLRNGQGGEDLLRALLRQTLLALHTLHSHNITHRQASHALLPSSTSLHTEASRHIPTKHGMLNHRPLHHCTR